MPSAGFGEGLVQIFSQRAVQRRIARVLSHPVVLLAIATVFATIAGAWLTNYYQEQAWMRDKNFETYQYAMDEGFKVTDELSDAMGQRLFGLNRVVWVAKGTGTGDLDEVWDEYYESVIVWNVKLARYKSRLARFVSVEAAEAFASPQDAALSYADGAPVSLHGRFLVAHRKVRALVDCVRAAGCKAEEQAAKVQEAEQELNMLGQAVDAFLNGCTNQLYQSS